ncbi:MAG: adenylosuccinate lyase [Phototrophicales bacterium]|nr:MAG: adenylosuccinate lyase [Phototrophicales bacterium]
MSFDHSTYLSPFTWRYGSDQMRHIWSDKNKRLLWRKLWVALAKAQQQAGLVTAEQVADLEAHQEQIDIERAHALEAELHHDLMAEVHTYAEQCAIGGGIIHLGATSMDIEDNADALRLRESCTYITEHLHSILATLAEKIEQYRNTVCMAFTHLQPAEPTTIGYRLAFYAQDLLDAFEELKNLSQQIKGKGLKGAVGTSASYSQLLYGTSISARQLEELFMQQIGLEAYEVASQTYPRSQDWRILNALASVAMTAYKLAFDVRILQTPLIGEWGEPFGRRQVGSSAMPFKRNPILAENIDSLARYVAALPRIMWDNAAHSLLERTLDDSGNRRSVLPEAFLATDEILGKLSRILNNLRIDEHAISRNVAIYGVFAATERLLMEAVRRGGNRQTLHEVIRQHSLAAWEALRNGEDNPLAHTLAQDTTLKTLMSSEDIYVLLDATVYVGDAPERASNIVNKIQNTLKK